MRPHEAFDALRDARLEPVLLGVPTCKSDGYLGYRVAVQEPPAGQDVPDGTRVYLALRTYVLSTRPIDEPAPPPPGTPAPTVVGKPFERAMGEITYQGLIAVVFQPERALTSLDVSRQEPQPGEPTSFREVAIFLD